jgi:hypothetical protein
LSSCPEVRQEAAAPVADGMQRAASAMEAGRGLPSAAIGERGCQAVGGRPADGAGREIARAKLKTRWAWPRSPAKAASCPRTKSRRAEDLVKTRWRTSSAMRGPSCRGGCARAMGRW